MKNQFYPVNKEPDYHLETLAMPIFGLGVIVRTHDAYAETTNSVFVPKAALCKQDDGTYVIERADNQPVERMARKGYEAYGNEADWKAYNGEAMPKWDELPDHIQRKWCIAAQAIARFLL